MQHHREPGGALDQGDQMTAAIAADEQITLRKTEAGPGGPGVDEVSLRVGRLLVGWTPELRDRKIDQLASVIAQMNNGMGPDLLGVCEVENRFVVDRVVGAVNAFLAAPRSYAAVHADTADARGIDVAFIYDTTLFEVPDPQADSVFFHVVMRRNATREIVQVNFATTTPTKHTWAVFGNHWPSRSGGHYESSGYRAIAGETLSYFHQRVLEVHGAETPVLAMGDFNDEPFDTSLVLHALSTRQRARVTAARENPLCGTLCGPSPVFPTAASTSTTSRMCSTSSSSIRTWPHKAHS